MATRFRKTKKVGAVRFTVGKKSFGTSVGGKFGGVSMNSKTGVRFRASIPGSGLSYSVGGKGGSSSGHSIWWWLFIGWWWWAVKITMYVTFFIPVQIYKLITKKKQTNSAPQTNVVSTGREYASVAPTPVISHDAEMAAFNRELDELERVEITHSDSFCKRRNPDTMPGIHITNITRRTNMEKIFPMVILDTETTGIGAAKNEIVELSAVKLESGFKIQSCFTTLIKPRKPIPVGASNVHHITDEMVSDAPSFPEIAQCFADYISGCNIAGHNVKFDLEFLYASGFDLPEKAKYYDTLDLAKKTLISEGKQQYDRDTGAYIEVDHYDVENYKLTTLCDYYGIYRSDAHRSLSDCLATAKVMEHLVEDKLADSE